MYSWARRWESALRASSWRRTFSASACFSCSVAGKDSGRGRAASNREASSDTAAARHAILFIRPSPLSAVRFCEVLLSLYPLSPRCANRGFIGLTILRASRGPYLPILPRNLLRRPDLRPSRPSRSAFFVGGRPLDISDVFQWPPVVDGHAVAVATGLRGARIVPPRSSPPMRSPSLGPRTSRASPAEAKPPFL